ncbi:MAG TPA: tetratricopeptide repeat protein, partial [Candidatus Krumholzibacteria bacterium]|nr:tetratricopeptide repeat protein [Candidatus Krumholzibacteria bacterium]
LSDNYWQTLAMFHLVVGDTARARTLLAGHTEDTSEQEREAIRIFQTAAAGDCASADAMTKAATAAKKIELSAEDHIYYVLGRCQLESGAYEAAIASLRRIVERPLYYGDSAPMIPVAWFYLGEAYERKGDVSRASDAYQRVLEIWKDGDADLFCRREARIRLDRLAGSRSM